MTAVADARSEQTFQSVFGSARGVRRSPRFILEAPETLASEELRRLMDLAVAKKFVEPVAALVACAPPLHHEPGTPASNADVLCMCVATQMVEATGDFVDGFAAALLPDNPKAYAAGLRSRMAEQLEPRLVTCPPADWAAWLDQQWVARFPHAVAHRFGGSLDLQFGELGEHLGHLTGTDWLTAARLALQTPRPVIRAKALSAAEASECRTALLAHLETLAR